MEDHNSRLHAGRGVNHGCDEPSSQRRYRSQTRKTGVAEIKERPRSESYGDQDYRAIYDMEWFRFHHLTLRKIIHFVTFTFSNFAFSGEKSLKTLCFDWDDATAASDRRLRLAMPSTAPTICQPRYQLHLTDIRCHQKHGCKCSRRTTGAAVHVLGLAKLAIS